MWGDVTQAKQILRTEPSEEGAYNKTMYPSTYEESTTTNVIPQRQLTFPWGEYALCILVVTIPQPVRRRALSTILRAPKSWYANDKILGLYSPSLEARIFDVIIIVLLWNLKFDRRVDSAGSWAPAKCQSDWTSLNPNLATSGGLAV